MNSGIKKSIYSFLIAGTSQHSADMTSLKVGDRAPQFETVLHDGTQIQLSDYAGKKLILFFYPADDTPGCTAAACSLRDAYSELSEKGYQMLGVSPDSEKSHDKFIKKFAFPFPLFPDVDQTVMKAYGVWGPRKWMGREFDGVHRTTFVIDEQGTIEQIFTKVDTKNHARQILDA
jgi:peroxiredoxin Q/BCP